MTVLENDPKASGSDKSKSKDQKITDEAKRRFDRCSSVESPSRKLYIEDLKFAEGDSDNLYQWSSSIRTARGYGTIDERPCLTINKVRQHNLQIINDARQNKPSVKIKPVGNGATYEAAQVFEGVVRHIEYISNAQSAYDTATSFQVKGGIGWWRVVTDYEADESFDQEIFIRRVKDPLSIYMDPDIREADGSDAKFAFVFDDMPKDEFEKQYPNYKDMAGDNPLQIVGSWVKEDHVRVAEYYRVVENKDALIAFTDPATGQQIIERKSKLGKELFNTVAEDPHTKTREIVENEVEWFLIVGDCIAERRTWPGKYIPLVRVIGEETNIEGYLDRKGHTRAMKDPQRIYNYWSSSAVEMVALQSKTPYIGPMDAFSNLETYWDTANTVNHAWLPYNQYDEKGMKLEPPMRQAPPTMAQAYLSGMQVSSEELRAVSGQWQSEMGMPSNEKSGVAIQQRQRQGENATYHFIDHLALAIRFTGKILIDLIPKIYDTKRVIKIMAEDGVEHQVTVDPNAQTAYLEMQKAERDKVESVFNPNVGRYDVEADIGPAYATRRQEAFAAFTELSTRNPQIMQIAGDLMFKSADFPMAEELAERFKRAIPPAILGEAPPPQMVQMQQQNQQLQDSMMKAMEALAEEKAKSRSMSQQKEIDVFKAVTQRMEAVFKQIVSPKAAAEMLHDLAMQEHGANNALAQASHSAALAPQPEPDGGMQ